MPSSSPLPPARRSGLWSDLARFVLRSPAEPTRVDLRAPEARERYDRRILERLGVSVAALEVLNIHRIGIDAAPELVWEELEHWNPDGGYWPAGIARGRWQGERFEHGRICLFGIPFLPVFRLDLARRQDEPPPDDADRARYVLYRCSGGYPMGVFSIYVRARIEAESEREPTQMFFMVSFDFFGRKHWLGTRAVRPLWESVHDRVTSQVLNRFKAHCQGALARRGAA